MKQIVSLNFTSSAFVTVVIIVVVAAVVVVVAAVVVVFALNLQLIFDYLNHCFKLQSKTIISLNFTGSASEDTVRVHNLNNL